MANFPDVAWPTDIPQVWKHAFQGLPHLVIRVIQAIAHFSTGTCVFEWFH